MTDPPPLRPLQAEAVDLIASKQRYPFLGDGVGSGKTRVALEVAKAWGCRKVIVSTTAATKGSWAEQVALWLGPEWPTSIVEGRTRPFDTTARVVIANHAIIKARLPELEALSADLFICDELHHIRNRNQQADAILRLAQLLPARRRMGLTATSVVNGHRDLINQLDFIGALFDEFGGPMRFLRTYCYGGIVRIGRGQTATDWSASINADSLFKTLDSRVWVRRDESVLLAELPKLQRVRVPVALSNRREYDRIERDMAEWMVEQKMLAPGADEATIRDRVADIMAGDGAALVQTSAYRHAVGRGKVAAAISWIADWLDSGAPLVVFCHHRDVAKAILDRFPAAVSVLGGDAPEAKDRARLAFQEGRSPLFVGSIEASGEGLTLTRAAACLFVELPWTYKAVVQASGRIRRIGQAADHLVAYFLMAEDSVDGSIQRVLERKAEVMAGLRLVEL